MKCKSARIEFKKGQQMTQYRPQQIPIFVVPPVFIKDISSYFDWVYSIWTTKVFTQEKSQTIFPYWSIIYSSSSSSYI